MDILSGEITKPKLFCLPSETRSDLKGKNLFINFFRRGLMCTATNKKAPEDLLGKSIW